ncbi:MAG: hypothetical protein IKD06_01130 [Clostridia bacterium]|nr:hypothetical protein [Clostridia bacterium]
MSKLDLLKQEIANKPYGNKAVLNYWQAKGFVEHFTDPVPLARAYAFAELMRRHEKHVYENDLILGSIHGIYTVNDSITDADLEYANRVVQSFGSRNFATNSDHYAPDYETFLNEGICGTLARIRRSREEHSGDADADEKMIFLEAMEISMLAFRDMVKDYAEVAAKKADECGSAQLKTVAQACANLVDKAPATFREALQLMWLTHVTFCYEGRYAMAMGRLDQILYPFYRKDVDAGVLTRDEAQDLVECTLYKIIERGCDTVNIAIGGVDRNGVGAVNELSYIFLTAVKNCQIPGPNLSARMYDGIPDEFIDACLQVIGTGIGYPAMMNDEVNIPALARYGYAIEDCRDYCMVGCIENFLQGKQPPWSDGRFNSPFYLELALNNGRSMRTGKQVGPKTGDPATFTSMDDVLKAFETQLRYAAREYVAFFNNENDRYNPKHYTQAFLSCFCRDCIGRAKDINDGGALYPSVHGTCAMGIGTQADSLAALEKLVFVDKRFTMAEYCQALLHNFEGYEELHAAALNSPKYGNNDDFVDKYAVWTVDKHAEIFSQYRTRDGGGIYIAAASNISNIYAGMEVAATPDGRKSGEAFSDAASPMHGMDKNGPTAVVQSITKPDYTKAACGTVVNQKFSPSMFKDPQKRAKLLAMLKVYFKQRGQEMQINSVSRDVLKDAMEHPDNYRTLVTRVSGYSAFYTTLDKLVQEDILKRTEHE